MVSFAGFHIDGCYISGVNKQSEGRSRTTKLVDVGWVSIPSFSENNHHGILRVFESAAIPFHLQRIFSVAADAGGLRGEHAHRVCSQLLTCVTGEIEVTCDDGRDKIIHLLTSSSDALLIPPGIWAVQNYLIDQSTLIVFCDQSFSESEYIRTYGDFLNWKCVS